MVGKKVRFDFSSKKNRPQEGRKEKAAERQLIQQSILVWMEEGNTITICRADQSEHLDKQYVHPSSFWASSRGG